MRAAVLVPALLAGFLLTAGCLQQQKAVQTQDIVSAVPWPDTERAEYVLLDRNNSDELGRGALTVARKDGQFELGSEFSNQDETDKSTVLVDGTTLKPLSVVRELNSKDQKKHVEGDYDAAKGIFTITEIGANGKKRPLPLRLDEHYYDNDSSLFLWRTIAFAKGYEANYRTVLAGSRTQQLVGLKVVRKDAITVPAGTFQAWRLEIRSEGVKQVAWYADTPAHPLVQYDNSLQLFQLTAVSADVGTN